MSSNLPYKAIRVETNYRTRRFFYFEIRPTKKNGGTLPLMVTATIEEIQIHAEAVWPKQVDYSGVWK